MARIALALALLAALPAAAQAGYTSTISGNTISFDGDSAADTGLTLDVQGQLLHHDRFAAGDPGFNSAFDFNTSIGGDQLVQVADATKHLNINAGGNNDSLTLLNKAAIALPISYNGGGGADSLAIDDTGDGQGRTVDMDPADHPNGVGGDFDTTQQEGMTFTPGDGDDRVHVRTSALFPSVFDSQGNDTYVLDEGVHLSNLFGGLGNDVIDYSNWHGPATARLATALDTQVSGGQVVAPTASAGTGFFSADIEIGSNNVYLGGAVQGLGGNITAARLHGPAAAGMNAASILNLASLPAGNAGTIPAQLFNSNAAVNSLLTGNAYALVTTTAFGTGEVRGQFGLTSFFSVSGTGNPHGDLEGAMGGAGDDVLSGTGVADTLKGNGGVDSFSGRAGDDTIDSRDGNAESVLCGLGTDTVTADAEDNVAGDCENVSRPASAAAATDAGGTGPGTDAPPILGPLVDRTPPAQTIKASKLKLKKLRRGKCSFTDTVSEPATLTARLLRGRKVLARGSGASTKAGKVTVKLGRSGKKVKPGAAVLEVTAVDLSGNRAVATRPVKLKR